VLTLGMSLGQELEILMVSIEEQELERRFEEGSHLSKGQLHNRHHSNQIQYHNIPILRDTERNQGSLNYLERQELV
jgi:hypothetical protein